MAYKVFTNGSVLQASEINDNLMRQAVMTFSNAAARTAAITSPIEGMVTYLEDTDIISIYESGAWRTSLSPRGGLLQVQNVTKVDAFSTTSSGADITGLSVTITPKSASSLLLVRANIAVSHLGGNAAAVSINKDGSLFAPMGATTEVVGPLSFGFVGSSTAGSTAPTTYTGRVGNGSGGSATSFINRWNINATVYSYSSITIMEVSA